jgi:oxygen-independent coproporphyrinogen-3 oxidase
MSFGVYIHIPYCLQKCVYCDFATVETGARISKILPPTAYVDRVKKEISLKGPIIGPREVSTIYFGGGTPSAIAPELLISIVDALIENGFTPKKDAELTLEINPGTLSDQDVEKLLKTGFNRFSVGVQTFKDVLLKESHRKHSSDETRHTLKLLQKNKVNYSADILFTLPHQNLDDLSQDLDEV